MPKSQRPGKEKSETGFWPTVTRPFRALGGRRTHKLDAVVTTQLPSAPESRPQPTHARRPMRRQEIEENDATPPWIVLLPRDQLTREPERCTEVLNDLNRAIQTYQPQTRQQRQPHFVAEPRLDVTMAQGTSRQALGRILIDESQKVSVLGRELTEGTLGGHILNTIRASIDTRRQTSNLGTQQIHHLIEVVANSIAPNYDRGGRLFIDERERQQARAEIRRIIIGQQKSDKPHPDDFLR